MSEPHQNSVGSRKRERPAGHLDLPCRAGRGTSEQVAAERLIRPCRGAAHPPMPRSGSSAHAAERLIRPCRGAAHPPMPLWVLRCGDSADGLAQADSGSIGSTHCARQAGGSHGPPK
jgi:hypothetical protein